MTVRSLAPAGGVQRQIDGHGEQAGRGLRLPDADVVTIRAVPEIGVVHPYS
jgi:hypothetical protein